MSIPAARTASMAEEPPDLPPEQHLEVLQPVTSASDYTARMTVSMDSTREEIERSRRLDDQITELKAEREASRRSHDQGRETLDLSLRRSRSRRAVIPEDDFDIATQLPNERLSGLPKDNAASSWLVQAMRHVHSSFWLLRYFVYITPIGALLVIPIVLGTYVFQNALVGGVYLMWFAIWLEIVWLSLWAGRILAHLIPWPMGIVTSLFTDSSKKWRDMAKQLEIPVTLFLWGLGMEVSFLPLMQSHMQPGYQGDTSWMGIVNEIIISLFVGLTLNLAEKTLIQLIAISFHTRTYQDRIQTNQTIIGFLIHLYTYSKDNLHKSDAEFEDKAMQGPGSGARTPAQVVEQAQHAFRKVGDAAGRVAEDFTGRKARRSTHPDQVVLVLLNTDKGCKVLARRLFRTFEHKYSEVELEAMGKDPHDEDAEGRIREDDLKTAFETPGAEPDHVSEMAHDAFAVFDRDMNGDINLQELEMAVMEAGHERKSILASLKDLDSVVSKLDEILVWLVVIITLLVFLSLVSKSAAGVLTSAGSSVLALSWLFATSAQEFLGSLIFVFIKHPFDVGDRVSIYGNTGSTLKGDDYYVKEVSLLYTEFKKLEGQVVQAPNNYLNTLFILNMRRSGGLAEAIPLTVRFGTTLDQIEALRTALLEFVTQEPREYQNKIITEVRDIVDCWSVTINVVFFYKTNWQNELLRLRRRNKFFCMLMHYINEIGIESPMTRQPGYGALNPLHINYGTDAPAMPPRSHISGPPPGAATDNSDAKSMTQHSEGGVTSNLGGAPSSSMGTARQPSIIRMSGGSRRGRSRGESVSSLSRRVDFSLGAQDAADMSIGDVHEESPQARTTAIVRNANAAAASRSRISTIEEGDEGTGSMTAGSRGRSSSIAAGGADGGNSDRGTSHHVGSRFLSGLHINRPRGDSSVSGDSRMERGVAGAPRSPLTPTSPLVRAARSGSLWSRPSNRRSLDEKAE